MDNALYVGLSRQITLRHELDIVANNIANADTTGFKVESLLVKTEPKAPAVTLDGPKPVKFVIDTGVARDFGQGTIRSTGSPLDLAIEGQAFFKITTPDGERYTRDGHFRLDDTGKLTTQNGQPVADAGGAELLVDMEKGPIAIAADGTVSQGIEQVGKIGVVRFDSLSVLEKTGDNLYRNTSNQQAQAAPDARIHQGMLEGSNVNAITQITKMLEVTRAYESMAKMMDSTATLSRDSISRLGKAQ
jgi:flagellar basal-body rod protein FlgF